MHHEAFYTWIKHSKGSLIRVDCQSYLHTEEIMHTALFRAWLNEPYNSPCLFQCNSNSLCLLDSNLLDHHFLAWPIGSTCLQQYCWPPLTLLSPCFADYLPPPVCNSVVSKNRWDTRQEIKAEREQAAAQRSFSLLRDEEFRGRQNVICIFCILFFLHTRTIRYCKDPRCAFLCEKHIFAKQKSCG